MNDHTSEKPRALELFAGIGGFAAAAGSRVDIVGAIDNSSHVLDVHALNFEHPTFQDNLATLDAKKLSAYEADIWWMSPPCQPYTVRGHQKDLEDHRAASLLNLLGILSELGGDAPDMIAMENVRGFHTSQAREKLLETLEALHYEVCERVLCPTELGAPAKRERYYLVASRDGLIRQAEPLEATMTTLSEHLDEEPDEELFIAPEIIAKHGPGMRIVDVGDPDAVTNCFTSAYGKTYRFSGSFFRHEDGRVRYASPGELLRLLHFPEPFHFPAAMTRRQRYKYVGNSLSVLAMREILRRLAPFEAPDE